MAFNRVVNSEADNLLIEETSKEDEDPSDNFLSWIVGLVLTGIGGNSFWT